MSEIAIRVENLGKQYKIGRLQKRHDTLRDSISDFSAQVQRQFRISDLAKRRNGQNHQSEIRNQKSDDTIWALRDVSFEVKRGEVVGIIGRNGAGKSTLLKILSRITEPTTGAVDLYGRVASLLEVGTGFHPELTGRENIFLNGAILGMRKAEIEKKFDEIVAFAEVEKFIDTPVKRYSSGMYVRLAFAVAAHLEPEILVVDEVLAVGDAAFQKKCLGKMGDVAKEGRTVLFVSHNMGAIQGLCTHGILLESGQVEKLGGISIVTNAYLEQIHQSIQGAMVDLAEWSNRSGTKRARITRFEILDLLGNPIQQVTFRDGVRFRLTCYFPRKMSASFGVIIHSLNEIPLMDIRSTNAGFMAADLEGTVILECQVNSIGLYPGEYYLSPWIADRMVKEDVDFVRYCAKLDVGAASGEVVLQLDPKWGKFFVDSKWRFVK